MSVHVKCMFKICLVIHQIGEINKNKQKNTILYLFTVQVTNRCGRYWMMLARLRTGVPTARRETLS